MPTGSTHIKFPMMLTNEKPAWSGVVRLFSGVVRLFSGVVGAWLGRGFETGFFELTSGIILHFQGNIDACGTKTVINWFQSTTIYI